LFLRCGRYFYLEAYLLRDLFSWYGLLVKYTEQGF